MEVSLKYRAINMDTIAKNYWNNRYASGGNSGYGSYDEQLYKKLKWLSGLDVKTITEIGCGDFNFGKHLLGIYPEAKYTGQDISDVIIEQNKIKYPQYKFTTNGPLLTGDLLLCIDVLYHVLDDKEYEQLLSDLKEGWTKYLAITAYETPQNTAGHLKVRIFDPKYFGKPIIREVVEDDGKLRFYLFKH